MANISGWDASGYDPDQPDFNILPQGEYTVCVTESDICPTKAGNGTLCKLKLKIIAGDHKNRTLYDNINLKNPNEDATRIGKRQMDSLLYSTGILKPSDTSELHNKPVIAVIEVQKRKDTGGLSNSVKKYKPLASGSPPAADGGDAASEPDKPISDQPWAM